MRRAFSLIAGCCVVVASSLAPASAQEGPVSSPVNTGALADLEGEIAIDGSSTVYLISSAAAEEFVEHAPEVKITVRFSGTSGGFDLFCDGETEIQNASRPITPEEAAACAENGIDFIELPVAMDGLTVVVHPENTWVDCLTVEELRTMWEPAADGTVTSWGQVRPGFPNMPLHLYGAGGRSGTFDYFTEAVTGESGASRSDYAASEDDRMLVEGVSENVSALGYFGYAYYYENQDRLKAVPIQNPLTGQCHAPSETTIRDGSYQPLSRPLFIYMRADAVDVPEVNAFVTFMLSPAFTPHILTPEIGYIPLSDELYTASAGRFTHAVTGTLFPHGQEVGATLHRYLDPHTTPAATPVT